MLNEAEASGDERWARETRQETRRMNGWQGLLFNLLAMGAAVLTLTLTAFAPFLVPVHLPFGYFVAILASCLVGVACGILGRWSSWDNVSFVFIFLAVSFVFDFSDFAAWGLPKGGLLLSVLMPVMGAVWLGDFLAKQWKPFGTFESDWF